MSLLSAETNDSSRQAIRDECAAQCEVLVPIVAVTIELCGRVARGGLPTEEKRGPLIATTRGTDDAWSNDRVRMGDATV